MKEMAFDFDQYENEVHRTGRIGLSIGILLLFVAPFLFAFFLHAHFNMKGFWPALVQVLVIYVPSSIVEYLVYVPLLGPGASYLSFITGNISKMKLPCAFTARDIAKTEVGTPEDEIITTLSVATSSLVTMLVIFLGVLLLIPLTPILQNPTLRPAFDNLLPCLFGALAMQYFKKNPILSIFPMLFIVILCSLVPSLIASSTTLLIPNGAISIGLCYLMYRFTPQMIKEIK